MADLSKSQQKWIPLVASGQFGVIAVGVVATVWEAIGLFTGPGSLRFGASCAALSVISYFVFNKPSKS